MKNSWMIRSKRDKSLMQNILYKGLKAIKKWYLNIAMSMTQLQFYNTKSYKILPLKNKWLRISSYSTIRKDIFQSSIRISPFHTLQNSWPSKNGRKDRWGSNFMEKMSISLLKNSLLQGHWSIEDMGFRNWRSFFIIPIVRLKCKYCINLEIQTDTR